MSLCPRPLDQRGDHVVGLVALDGDVAGSRRPRRAGAGAATAGRAGRARRALRLVVGRDLLAPGQARVPDDDRRHLAVVGEDLHEHRREAEDRVGGPPVGRRDGFREREERAERERVPVDQEQLARGRRPSARGHSRGRGAGSGRVLVAAAVPAAHLRPVLAHPPRPDRPPPGHARPRRDRDRRGRRHDRRRRARRRDDGRIRCATSRSTRATRRTSAASSRPCGRSTGAEVVDWSDRTLGMHVGGKLEVALKHPLRTAGRPLDGLHARRGARLHGDRRRPGQGVPVHDQAQHGRRRDRRQRPCSASATSAREASLPVMEGKAMLFKEFAGVDAFPLCLGHEGHRRDRRHRARRSRPASAASTSRTSARRAASRSRRG